MTEEHRECEARAGAMARPRELNSLENEPEFRMSSPENLTSQYHAQTHRKKNKRFLKGDQIKLTSNEVLC